MAESQTKPAPLGSIEELFGRFAPEARRYATAMLRNESDAEDVVQDAFVRLARRVDDQRLQSESVANQESIDKSHAYDDASQLKAMLFTVVRNLCIDNIRKNRRRKTIPFTQFHESGASINESSSQPQVDGASEAILQKTISTLMDQMTPQWNEALKLKINGQLTYQQIATIMSQSGSQVSHAQVRTWIFRGRQFLKSELERLGLIGGQS